MHPDRAFLEQRRKGLQRFINFIVNHPILREDGCLGVFLAEPNFEGWRKRSKVNLDEESMLRSLDPAEQARVPEDVDARIDLMRRHLPTLLDSHNKMVIFAEKTIRRMETASAESSRLAMTLATLGEVCPQSCWRNIDQTQLNQGGGLGGAGCDLCKGVARGLGAIADAWGREAEDTERRSSTLAMVSLEALKTQRDLYAAFRDLLVRHERE